MPEQAQTTVRSRRLTIVQTGETPGEPADAFALAVRSGLTSEPRTLPCRYFYDEEGSRLFEQICDLPEYYLTRTEDALLRDHADAMVDGWAADPVLIELGSGSSSKTRRLIAAAIRAYGGLHYVPIDVSRSILEGVGRGPGPRLPPASGHRPMPPTTATPWSARLSGSTARSCSPSSVPAWANYEIDEAVDLLALIARGMDPSDRLLLGTDLDKDPAILEAAYDDSRGVTARFNLNILARINRELGGRFVLDRFRHEARYHAGLRRVEMHLVSLDDQDVFIPGAGLTVAFARGDSIHTENSHKYTPELLQTLAERAGLEEDAAWVDARGWFRVQRWRPLRPIPPLNKIASNGVG